MLAAAGTHELKIGGTATFLNDSGQVTLTVDSIVVTGDSATVVLEERYSKDTSMNEKRTYKFVREGGAWKNCGPLNGDTGTNLTPTP